MKHFENDDPTIDMDEQNANKDRIINTLRSFGIEISTIKATVGPTVTLYEITPEQGVRISKIRGRVSISTQTEFRVCTTFVTSVIIGSPPSGSLARKWFSMTE